MKVQNLMLNAPCAWLESLGAKRFEGMALHDQAMVLAAQGPRTKALDSIRAGLAISREAGLSFVGPWILGHLAVLTDDPL